VVKDPAALVGTLRSARVPLELVLTHQLLHRVAPNVLAVQARLPDARAVAQRVALVLRHASPSLVVVPARHNFVNLFFQTSAITRVNIN
jgi:hypothetical protein